MPSDLRPDMGARIVDGKTIGLDIQQDVAREVRELNERGVYPRLAAVSYTHLTLPTNSLV